MFSLFLNDIELHLHNNLNAGITLDQLTIYLLLFADDAAVLSQTASGLQKSLDSLTQYCSKWNLSINIDKTKVVVFNKGGRLKEDYKWYVSGNEVTWLIHLITQEQFFLVVDHSYMPLKQWPVKTFGRWDRCLIVQKIWTSQVILC